MSEIDLVIDPPFGVTIDGKDSPYYVALRVYENLLSADSQLTVRITRNEGEKHYKPIAEKLLSKAKDSIAIHHGKRGWSYGVLAALSKGSKGKQLAENIVRGYRSEFHCSGTIEQRHEKDYRSLSIAPNMVILYTQVSKSISDMDREAEVIAKAILSHCGSA